MENAPTYAAFVGVRLLAAGGLATVLERAKRWHDRGGEGSLLIFEDQTGRQVEFDFRGTLEDVLARELSAQVARGPGRPKLGVVSREVSLLPKHWAFLEEQPNGISAALRRLVDEASKRAPDQQRARRARDAAYRFMTAIAGDRPNYEEASRALYAGDRATLDRLTRSWPKDVRKQVARLLDAPPSAS
jgi:uncharacterized protein